MSAEKEESEEQRFHLDVLHITTITPKIDGFSLHVGYAICFTLSLSIEMLQDNLLNDHSHCFQIGRRKGKY